jgi:hypothetical protein
VDTEYNRLYGRRYRRTLDGTLKSKYCQMSKRIRGLDNRGKYYVGKDICSREVFYRWAYTQPNTNRLWNAYVKSGFKLKLALTIDRIDSRKGYTIDNMRFVTFSENSRGLKRRLSHSA